MGGREYCAVTVARAEADCARNCAMQNCAGCGTNLMAGAESDVGQIAFHIILVAGCATIAALATPGPASAGGKGRDASMCVANVQCWLKDGGVDLATVESIKFDKRSRTNGQGDRVFQGWQGWVRFKDRDGAIVFSMQRDCRLQSSWTEGDIEWNEPGGTC